MYLDQSLLDNLEEVLLIVENPYTRCHKHGIRPGFELGRLGVRVVFVERDNVFTKNAPELIDDSSSDECSVVEVASLHVSIRGTPTTRTEPR